MSTSSVPTTLQDPPDLAISPATTGAPPTGTEPSTTRSHHQIPLSFSRPSTASSSLTSTPQTFHHGSDHHISTSDIPGIAAFDTTVPRPNAIRINVAGAFIVDEDESNGRQTPPGTRDIALPHHNSEVSHIAVDVSIPFVRICNATWGGVVFCGLLFSSPSHPRTPPAAQILFLLIMVFRLVDPSLKLSTLPRTTKERAAVSTLPSSRRSESTSTWTLSRICARRMARAPQTRTSFT